jgi:TolB-like protein/predicted Ser/Thr protein kinase
MSDRKPTSELDDTVGASDAHTNPFSPASSGAAGISGVLREDDARHDLAGAAVPAEAAEKLAGRYELLALLGSGGMGAVYKARDLELGELIAVKVLRSELSADPQMISRFRQEVRLARRVTHANVARTFDIGEHGSHKFLTMELIEGTSLGDALRQEARMPLARFVDIASAICAGLGAAHAAGIVHRDLKPDNVLLGKDGRVVITDFGIARVADPVQHEAVRTIGTPLGTPAYMAPEQVEGSPNVDARADIYAFGTMLYEMLTGTRAWQGDSVFWVASRRLVEPPPDPRKVRADLPTRAAEIVLKCMARQKEARYQSAAEVANELAEITAPRSISSLASVSVLVGAQVKSVAVLPFRNAGAPSDAYLADGLTDDLIDVLSMTPGLRVCGRGVVMGRTGGSRDPREIGQDLGVDVVVEGTVRHADDRLRVSARLVSVIDGFQLWAKRFDRNAGEFFEVNDEVARAVAEALTCKVEQAPREAATDPVALDLYLRARHEYYKYWRENVIAAIDLFEQALARAPDDPMILAGYAMALTRRSGQDDSTDAHAEGARRAAERALELAPESAQAHVALAHVRLLSGQSALAAREVRGVLDRNPKSADALELAGRMLLECGPITEGIKRLELALELEPNVVTVNLEIARVQALAGDRAASDAFFGDEPANPGLSNIYWLNRIRVALWLNDTERAHGWRTMMEARPGTFPGILMMLRAITGDFPTAVELQTILDIASSGTSLLRRRALYAQLVCEFSAVFGQRETALNALETADAGHFFDATWIERCPSLASIRSEPRFIGVRSRVLVRAAEVRIALGVG